MKKVVISGYYGFNNAGDEAVLGAMLSAMREQAAKKEQTISFTVLSANPADTAARYHVDTIGRTHLWQIIRVLLGCNMFISGGGGLLQDTTGLRLSVAYYLGLVFLARLFGKPAVLYAHGIGPVRRPFNRFLVRFLANRATMISVRDSGSMEELTRMGVTRPPITLTADPAFLLTVPENVPPYPFREKRPTIGIAVRAWQGQGRYLPEIAAAADTLAEELGANLLLIPMYHSADLPVSRELAAMLNHDAVVLEQNLPPSELLGIFSHLDLVLAVRLHALIFAAVAGIPMVGIGYDPKVDALLQRLGFDTAGDTGEVSAQELVRQAQERWQQRENIRKTLIARREEFRREALQAASQTVETLFETW